MIAKKLSPILLSVIILLLFITGAAPLYAQEPPVRNILLVNSYHQTMRWTQDMVAAVYAELQPDENNLQLFIENMDTKRNYNEPYMDVFADLLQAKYRDTHFDLILVTDNNAFTFMRQRRDQLFPQIPVIFCGINNLDMEHLEGLFNFTGVEEIFDTTATVDLALKNHPDTEEIFVVNDYLTTGRAIVAKMRIQLKPYSDRVKISYNDNLSVTELNAQIRALKPGTIVLLGAFYSAPQNTHVPGFYQTGLRLVEDCPVPAYAIYDFNIHKGIIGGKIASSYQQGKKMGILANKVLAGAKADTLPVIRTGTTEYVFNFEDMEHFSIAESDLPEGSRIVNRPFSLYREYREELILIGTFIALLLVIIFALLISITRRHQAEQKLRENELKLKTIFNQSHAFISLIAADGTLLDINQPALTFCGRSKEEVQHKHFCESACLHQQEAKQLMKQALQDAATGKVVKFELPATSAAGEEHIFDITISPVLDDKNNTVYFVLERHDISRQAKLAEQLRHAQKMEAIGTLAGGIAHDFNNILSGILGFSEMNLLDPNCTENIQSNSEKINSAAIRGRELVLQILTFSRKDDVRIELIKIDQIVQETIELLEKTLAKNVPLEVSIDPQTGWVLADKTQLHQIVMNLCTNACHAIRDNSGHLVINLEAVCIDQSESHGLDVLIPGQYACLSVNDSGSGIAEEDLERIFDPFFTTKKQGEGTGLGLSVVHGIIQNLGGAIDVKSQLGSGTIFSVWIPLSENEPEEVSEPEDNGLKTEGHEHVLWVDDEAMLVTLGQQFLESLGYRVTAMESSKDALELFKSCPEDFDLIFSDLVMPEMTGDQLAKAALEIRSDIPIILCSGHSETMDRNKVLALGAKDLLMKPLRLKNLARRIRTVLDS